MSFVADNKGKFTEVYRGDEADDFIIQDEWLTTENLQDMVQTLLECDYEQLALIRQIWPAHALTAAAKMLDVATKRRIKEWVIQQNLSIS